MTTWTKVTDGHPPLTKINGFWQSVPVIVALKSGQVCGAFFTYVGGDDVYPDDPPVPTYGTDEGLAYSNVLAWAPMPEFPNDLL